jgi:hypothetical protein
MGNNKKNQIPEDRKKLADAWDKTCQSMINKIDIALKLLKTYDDD